MLLFAKLFLSVLTFSAPLVAKDRYSLDTKDRYPFLINYFPSALVAKDIAFGLEKKLNRKFILETTLAWHCLTKPQDYYQQGGRFDLLPKYVLLTKSNLEWTMVSDLYYLQYFSRDTWFAEQIVLLDRNQTASDPLYRTKENKSLSSVGMGLGIGFRYRISRHFSICSENFLTYSKTTRKQTITQTEYFTSTPFSFAPGVGSETQHLSPRFGWRSTLKISYALSK